ncbi:MAG: hypothetical protein M3139_05075 [Bacteroidota bacterium]|nr:hypothetical protein [Bacteroidota bacterium]
MKKGVYLLPIVILLAACNPSTNSEKIKDVKLPIAGTWKLISGTLIDKGDTTITDYTKNISFIKILNENHFAFLSHDLSKGKAADSTFTAGGGRYDLKDSSYTEHLEYCSDRQWEGNDFNFTILIKNDTLTQTGREKVVNTGIDRLNIEKYSRMKN